MLYIKRTWLLSLPVSITLIFLHQLLRICGKYSQDTYYQEIWVFCGQLFMVCAIHSFRHRFRSARMDVTYSFIISSELGAGY